MVYSIVSIGRLAMLLKALVVRSTTQKDKAFPTGPGENSKGPAKLGDAHLSLVWNGQDDSCSHRRDCSACPWWKPRKVLGPLTRFMTSTRRLSITMFITW